MAGSDDGGAVRPHLYAAHSGGVPVAWGWCAALLGAVLGAVAAAAHAAPTASSELPPHGATDYEATNVLRLGDLAWCEGVAGAGIGEWVEIDGPMLAPPAVARWRLEWAGGNRYRPDLRAANGEPLLVRIAVQHAGRWVADFEARVDDDSADTHTWLWSFLAAGPAPAGPTRMRATILDVRTGAMWDDTCVDYFRVTEQVEGVRPRPLSLVVPPGSVLREGADGQVESTAEMREMLDWLGLLRRELLAASPGLRPRSRPRGPGRWLAGDRTGGLDALLAISRDALPTTLAAYCTADIETGTLFASLGEAMAACGRETAVRAAAEQMDAGESDHAESAGLTALAMFAEGGYWVVLGAGLDADDAEVLGAGGPHAAVAVTPGPSQVTAVVAAVVTDPPAPVTATPDPRRPAWRAVLSAPSLAGAFAAVIGVGFALLLAWSRRGGSRPRRPAASAAGAPAAVPGSDVLIIYASPDRPRAEKIVRAIEGHGLRCWIAPRNQLAGLDWAEQIVEALRGAQGVLLVMTANTGDSPHIRNEVELAVGQRRPILTVFLEDVQPPDALLYFIGSRHWFRAWQGSFDGHVPELLRHVRALLDRVGESTADRTRP